MLFNYSECYLQLSVSYFCLTTKYLQTTQFSEVNLGVLLLPSQQVQTLLADSDSRPCTRTADILTQSVIWRTWAVC